MNRDKIIGMTLGSAIGDQLFMPAETFLPSEILSRFRQITTYVQPPYDHRWFGDVRESRWTDDTQLTLAVAESLIKYGRLNLPDMAQGHVESLRTEGSLGFGKSTLNSILRLAKGIPYVESGEPDGYGNGVAMKIAPLAAMGITKHGKKFYTDGFGCNSGFWHEVALFTQITHKSYIALESAFVHCAALQYCLATPGTDCDWRNFFYSLTSGILTLYNSIFGQPERFPLNIKPPGQNSNHIQDRILTLHVLSGEKNNFLHKLSPLEIWLLFGRGSCYAYDSIPFSYAFFLRNPHSIKALYEVGNAGGDTDTNASIVGGMLGALNGTKIFPKHLVDGLWQKDRILDTANRFCDVFEIKD